MKFPYGELNTMISDLLVTSSGLLTNVDFLDWRYFPIVLYAVSAVLSYYGSSRIRFYTCYVLYTTTVIFGGFIALPYFLCYPKHPKNIRFGSTIVKFLMNKPMGIKWTKKNVEVLEETEGAVVVCNHQSIIDVLGLFQIADELRLVSPLMKNTLLYVPLFNVWSYLTGCIFIDRSNRSAAMKTLQTAQTYMRKDKRKILIYPEGTRNNSGTLLPFKKGAFRTAIDAQAPIIPIVLSPYYFINYETKAFEKGEIIISVLDPIPTTGLTPEDTDQLVQMTRKRMCDEFELIKIPKQKIP